MIGLHDSLGYSVEWNVDSAILFFWTAAVPRPRSLVVVTKLDPCPGLARYMAMPWPRPRLKSRPTRRSTLESWSRPWHSGGYHGYVLLPRPTVHVVSSPSRGQVKIHSADAVHMLGVTHTSCPNMQAGGILQVQKREASK